jgi:hypothetical protein
METQENLTTGSYFRALRVIYNSFFVGQVVLAIIGIVIISLDFGSNLDSAIHNTLLFIGLIYATYYLFNKIKTKKQGLDWVHKEKDFPTKLNLYKAYLIKNWGNIVGGNFFMLICGFVSSDYKFYIFFVLFILIFIFSWQPKMENAIRDLSLNKEEELILRNPNALII